ncbi:MAG: addiction module protein [Chloroflexota bacterium]|nr:addiction module protein [Chloroflexota bacterium]
MNANTKKMISQTLRMPVSDRAIIAERLIASLDTPTEHAAEIQWQEEIQRRLSEIDNSIVDLISWEEVKKLLGRF